MLNTLKKLIKKNKLLFHIFNEIINYRIQKMSRYYDHFQSNVVGGSTIIKINNIPGEYEMDTRSDILKRVLLKKEYEDNIVKLILKNVDPNKDAINIGANIGLFANLLAENINQDKKVLAIEPTPRAFEILLKNNYRNNHQDKIITFKGLAIDTGGSYEINIVSGKEEYSTIGKMVHPSIKRKKFIKEKVVGTTLDSLVKKHKINPGIIVIDVEGAEMKALKGATLTIKNSKPVIVSELDDLLLQEQGSNSKEVLNFLKDLDYKIIDSKGDKLNYPFTGNILAIPINE